MDSGSSGSIQSSSGGDEEYDSRAHGISGFLNNPPTPTPTPTPTHVGPMANATPCPSPLPHSSSSIFDPFSNFFHPNFPTHSNNHQHQNSLLNLHTAWPRNPMQLPASNSIPSFSFITTAPQFQVPEVPRPLTTLTTDPSDVLNTTPAPNPGPVRNPRKRTRASRRAPTTVLTTDTSNFRAMVQEFTGIPAPPFTPASSFPRARLDLFGGTSTSSPPYLLRPFPQKLSPFAPPTPTPTSTTTSILSSSSQFLLPKHNHLPLPTMNPIFNLQQPTTHNSNINLLGSHLQVSVDSSTPHSTENRNPHHLPEEFLGGNVSVRDSGGNANILPTSWGSAGGGGAPASDQTLFRSINAKYCAGTGTKLNNNYSASSSSDFHGDKGSEINNNVTTRTEGMIESWICSSD